MTETIYRCKECDRVVGTETAAVVHSCMAAEMKGEVLQAHPSSALLEDGLIVEGHHLEPLTAEESEELHAHWAAEGRRCRSCGVDDHCTECCAFGRCVEAEAVVTWVFTRAGGVLGEPAPPGFISPDELGRRTMAILKQGPDSDAVREAVRWFAEHCPPQVTKVRSHDEARDALYRSDRG